MTSRIVGRVMGALAVSVVAVFATASIAGEKESQPRWKLDVRGGSEVRYDDNILSLSETEKDRVSDPNRFKIESVGDAILIPSVFLQVSRQPHRGRETNLFLSVRAYDYFRNSIKDYQTFSVGLRQELNRSRRHRTALRVGASWIPEYYMRQLIDDDESAAAGQLIRNELTYAKKRGYVEISQEIVDSVLTLSGTYSRERRDYNSHFDERDSSSNVFTLDLDVYPLRRHNFRVTPYFERETRSSRGDLSSSTVVDDDVGFDSNLSGLSLRGLWGPDSDHRRIVRAFYEREDRNYTTRFSPDTGHFRRSDEIRKLGVGFEQELGPTWRWGVAAYNRNNRVLTPTNAGSDHERNVVSASLTYRFERRLDRRGREMERRRERESDAVSRRDEP